MSDINNKICEYLYGEWIKPYKSQRSFALDHGIEESTVRKIKSVALKTNKSAYNIPVVTVQKICDARSLKVSEFFETVGL